MPERGSPHEVTYRQMEQGIDFDEDELLPGEEAARAAKPGDPKEQLVTDERREGK